MSEISNSHLSKRTVFRKGPNLLVGLLFFRITVLHLSETYVEIPYIDAQYVPGFAWTRQPQVCLVKNISPILAVGVSAENPQTTESGALPPTFTYNQAATGGGLFNSANSIVP